MASTRLFHRGIGSSDLVGRLVIALAVRDDRKRSAERQHRAHTDHDGGPPEPWIRWW